MTKQEGETQREVSRVLDRTQPGLMYFPKFGRFAAIRLTSLDEGSKDAVWRALRALEQTAGELTGQGHPSRFVAAFHPDVWRDWSGQDPAGRPPADSILRRSPLLKDDNGDDHLWFFLKSDSRENCRRLEASLTDELGDLVDTLTCTPAAQRKDGKVLDHHFSDGVTSPSDPLGVAGPIVQSGDGGQAGSCWVFTQKFEVRWGSYGPQDIDAKEDVIGRGVNGAILPDDDPHSHIRRARVFDGNQDNLKLLRQALPYGAAAGARGREEGIYFVSFSSSADPVEAVLESMAGTGSHAPDKLLNFVASLGGGYWYVPDRVSLGLAAGLRPSDFVPAEFWQVRSANGYMFYNGNDYINIMSTGQYAPGDPPSDRILELSANIFSRWRDNWYELRDIPKIAHLKEFLDPGQGDVLTAPVAIRKGIAIKKTLTEVLTHPDPDYPVDPGSHAWKADTFRVHPRDLLFGVMPELSLARGKEVMPYLQEGDERITSYLMGIDEGGMVGHVVPDHPATLGRGLAAFMDKVRQKLDQAQDSSRRDFYQSVIYALEGVQGWCLNYAALAEKMLESTPRSQPGVRANLEVLAQRARKLSTDKPGTFAEGVQFVYMMHCCMHLIGNPVSIGRLDQYLADLYEQDQDVTEEQAQELIDALWVKLDEKAIHNRHYITDHLGYGMTAVPYSGGNFPQGSAINQWIQQVTVGGLKRDGSGGCNPVTMLCLKASRRLPFNAPCLSLRVYSGMPQEVVDEASKALLSGGAHPILFQDERMVTGLHEFSGFPLEDARDYACDGCYEPMINGKTEFTFGSVAPLDALEMAVNQGATIMGSGVVHLRGLQQADRTPHPRDIKSFEEVQELMRHHLYWLTVRLFNGILVNYGNIGKVSPCPLLSTMMDGCMERGTDIYSGGARYHLIAPMFVGMSTTIDSLYAVKKLVFDPDTAVTTLEELVDCLRSDWGHNFTEPFQSTLAGRQRAEVKGKWFQEMRQMALNMPKFGTGKAEVDELGAWLADSVSNIAREIMENPPGIFAQTLENIKQTYGAEMHMCPGIGTFEEYVGAGQNSAASADGRRWAQPYPSDFSPTPVPQDLPAIAQGPGAVQPRPDSYRDIYESMKSWDDPAIYNQISNAAPVDLNIREDFSEARLAEFIRRYAEGQGVGSNLITVSCGDPDTYQAAESEPERYELVRVRMGGWTEFFAAMFPVHQEQHRRRPWFTAAGDGQAGEES